MNVLAGLLLVTSAGAAAGTASPVTTAASPGTACAATVNHPEGSRVTYFRHCADTPELVSFHGGRYQMGDAVGDGKDYELPVHEVTIAPFAIGRYEVTRGEWQACVAAGVCTPPQQMPTDEQVGARYPIASVTWLQAKEYVAWLVQRTGRAYRLPSEAEWEYAARAGRTDERTWDAKSADQVACQYANVLDRTAFTAHREMTWFIGCNDGFAETAPVGSFLPNAWGVYDMLGNVWEWVEDCWHSDYTGAPVDGSAWTTGGNCRKRVNRGGGWGNGARSLRLSNRDADAADNFSGGIGFRVALSLAKPR